MPSCSSARVRSADDCASASRASVAGASRTCTSPCRTVSTTRTSPRARRVQLQGHPVHALAVAERAWSPRGSPGSRRRAVPGSRTRPRARRPGSPRSTCGADWVGAGAVVSAGGRHRCLRRGPRCRVGCVVLRLVRGPGLRGVRRRRRRWSSGSVVAPVVGAVRPGDRQVGRRCRRGARSTPSVRSGAGCGTSEAAGRRTAPAASPASTSASVLPSSSVGAACRRASVVSSASGRRRRPRVATPDRGELGCGRGESRPRRAPKRPSRRSGCAEDARCGAARGLRGFDGERCSSRPSPASP